MIEIADCIRTKSRDYTITRDLSGVCEVSFRNISPKTGKTCGQTRRVVDGVDCFVLTDKAGLTTGMVVGHWDKSLEYGGSVYTWARIGYSTLELARAAVERHTNQ